MDKRTVGFDQTVEIAPGFFLGVEAKPGGKGKLDQGIPYVSFGGQRFDIAKLKEKMSFGDFTVALVKVKKSSEEAIFSVSSKQKGKKTKQNVAKMDDFIPAPNNGAVVTNYTP
jgi:hypothetical protein